MDLFYSTASPFVRKVLILIHEKGLQGDIALTPAMVSPVAQAQAVVAHNPTGHIPTLILDDGIALFDSSVICQYLGSLAGGDVLLPEAAGDRCRVLCLEALADGIMDAGVLLRFEKGLRPADLRWDDWIEGQTAKISNSIAMLQARWMDHLRAQFDLGTISAICALSYIDFRHPHIRWRESVPELASWFAEMETRPSVQATGLKQMTAGQSR